MSRRGARIVRVEVLERAARTLLAELLSREVAFFRARGFSIEALGGSSPADRDVVHALDALLHDAAAAPAMPHALRDALRALDALATSAGAEELVRLDAQSRRLPRATLGEEDLALTALLRHPDLAADALEIVAFTHDASHAFTEYEPADGRTLAWIDGKHRAALAAALGGRLEARDRTRYCEVRTTETDGEWAIAIAHGDRPKTRERVDAGALSARPVTDIAAHKAHVRLSKHGGKLAVRAWPPTVHELVRRSLGEVLAGDEDHFRADEAYDLSPFLRPDAALARDGVPGLAAVEMQAMSIATPGGVRVQVARPRKDLLSSDAAPVLDAALAYGRVVAVTLYVTVDTGEGRAKRSKVELNVKERRTEVQFDREDSRIAGVVREYLIARGVMRLVTREAAVAV